MDRFDSITLTAAQTNAFEAIARTRFYRTCSGWRARGRNTIALATQEALRRQGLVDVNWSVVQPFLRLSDRGRRYAEWLKGAQAMRAVRRNAA